MTLTAGYLPLTVSSVAITGSDPGDFTQANTCGAGIQAGAECTISATFTPAELGPRTASVVVHDSSVQSLQSAGLSGTGVTSGPNANLSPGSLSFATQVLSTTSAAKRVTLANYGATALDITSITATGDFAASNNCGSNLAAGASCTIM